MSKESYFQERLIDEIQERFPEAIIMKNDEQYIQGIPDLTILYGDTYAMLECKRDRHAARRPNQEYYIEHVNNMGGFAAFIYPENKEEILDAMEQSFQA